MSKPYSESEFSAQITADRNWRIREISDLKLAIKRGDGNMRKVLLRALVAICYAHWEGYVKFSARKYFEHIALRKIPYSALDRQFLRNYFLPRLAALATSKISVAERCTLVDEVLDCSERRFTHVNDDLINTKANLNFNVFADICLVCGVSVALFEDSSTFIDVILLKRRNSIAHGEDTMVAFDDMDDIAENTIGIMRSFGNELENRVVLQAYKGTQAPN
ncbi:MAE_28990/MAE_18760 family HEPN-like nuclease [Rugamonas sp. DEMB1]|uniref:MAE_28990/MAE_18760 family HEPN-like nuclease n=1 Tax=Rugamonas sp. DEMB1 TaxID=3039386 RepID=UPI002446CF28|nr:MAE_28990/MAE_18760 family HEPN-like nuclease [Rugamonas sp. DEMB1]WGG48273.1 MAE_28990/MAE_18760 family HEPN-like nuclease [Rugamonas sp. DEMB1]